MINKDSLDRAYHESFSNVNPSDLANIEWGAEIETPGNEMPDFLTDNDRWKVQAQNHFGDWCAVEMNGHPSGFAWRNIPRIRLRADHPYYARMTDPIQSAISTLTQAGYTVTPPDPMIKDREFVAGIFDAAEWGSAWEYEQSDDAVRAIMDYLRANKEKI